MRMKVSDYIVEFLASEGIHHVFGVTGGAIAHVFDSIGKSNRISYVCPQHEQAAAMAADAYARVTGNIGVVVATSGPGATNLLTGVACAFTDSIPLLCITGQVSTFRLRRQSGVRQLGFQEIDTVEVFRPVTKYAQIVEDPLMIRQELERAVFYAKSGRQGPVLIDIPDNVQREFIEVDQIPVFSFPLYFADHDLLNSFVVECISEMKNAKRPVLIIGGGVVSSGAKDEVSILIDRLQIPVLTTWATKELVSHDHPLLVGGFGVTAERYGNFCVQNADLIVAIGSRLDTHATGSPVSSFGREAKKMIVDIDVRELEKFSREGMKSVRILCADAKEFIRALLLLGENYVVPDIEEWRDCISRWKERFPICPSEYFTQRNQVNPYVFLQFLSNQLRENDIIIADTGSNVAQTFQSFKVKKGQRLFSAFNYTPMGYALPAAIGACFASGKQRIICIIGDGGLQMNIQELATIAKHKLPIKLIVLNNRGYGMIRQTQEDWLESRYEASSEALGIAVPDFIRIAAAYDIRAIAVRNYDEINAAVVSLLSDMDAVVCEVSVAAEQKTIPMLKYGRPIEDANPLLEREEFRQQMIVFPLTASMNEE